MRPVNNVRTGISDTCQAFFEKIFAFNIMVMAQISFENSEQKSIYNDFVNNITLINLALYLQIRQSIDDEFDAKKFKRRIVTDWFESVKNTSKESINNWYTSTSQNKIVQAFGPDVEDYQAKVNKDLTFVKKAVEEILDIK